MKILRKRIKTISKDFFCLKLSSFFSWLNPNSNLSLTNWLAIHREPIACCLLLIVICLLPMATKAQNKEYAKQVIEKLCSDEYAGRGYVKDGDKKAAKFIAESFIL